MKKLILICTVILGFAASSFAYNSTQFMRYEVGYESHTISNMSTTNAVGANMGAMMPGYVEVYVLRHNGTPFYGRKDYPDYGHLYWIDEQIYEIRVNIAVYEDGTSDVNGVLLSWGWYDL